MLHFGILRWWLSLSLDEEGEFFATEVYSYGTRPEQKTTPDEVSRQTEPLPPLTATNAALYRTQLAAYAGGMVASCVLAAGGRSINSYPGIPGGIHGPYYR